MNDAVTRETLIHHLQKALGADAVLSDASDTAGYTEDWRGRYRGEALCVVLPSSTAQVSEVVKRCAAAGVPILPQGGNTSLCAGAVPPGGGPSPVIVIWRVCVTSVRSMLRTAR